MLLKNCVCTAKVFYPQKNNDYIYGFLVFLTYCLIRSSRFLLPRSSAIDAANKDSAAVFATLCVTSVTTSTPRTIKAIPVKSTASLSLGEPSNNFLVKLSP